MQRGNRSPIVYPSVLLTLVVIALSFALTPWAMRLAVILLTSLSVAVFFYNLIWQYRKIDNVIGGIREASYMYTLAFALLLPGYVSAAMSYLSKKGGLGLFGGFLILLGILFAQGSNALLLDHFIYGRRWKLAEPRGSIG